jgi:hypothetical protein
MVTWQRDVVDRLRELSNADKQEQAWVNKIDGSLPSPTELVCMLFDDTGIQEEMESGVAFSPRADALLRQLDQMLDPVDVEIPPSELLASDAWKQVRLVAQEALSAIHEEWS